MTDLEFSEIKATLAHVGKLGALDGKALIAEVERLRQIEAKLERIGMMLCVVNDIERNDVEDMVRCFMLAKNEEVERLRTKLADAKRIGAAEELERMARMVEQRINAPDFTWMDIGPSGAVQAYRKRAAELRAGGKV